MKINTDGVLLGALADADHPKTILDIGTGTGVIALMLAQRFNEAIIDAVEIDQQAAETVKTNFSSSPFADRLTAYPTGFEQFFAGNPKNKYDLIVSNPPFYINSLESPKSNRTLAKHSEVRFFETLMKNISRHLSVNGLCWLILPLQTASEVKALAAINGLKLYKNIFIKSFNESESHREILCFGSGDDIASSEQLVIYEQRNVYSAEYIKLLQPYFIAF